MNKAITLAFLVVLVSVGCVTPPSGDYYREDPFGGNFTYSGEPKLGEEFEVVFNTNRISDTYTDIGVSISPGMELVGVNASYVMSAVNIDLGYGEGFVGLGHRSSHTGGFKGPEIVGPEMVDGHTKFNIISEGLQVFEANMSNVSVKVKMINNVTHYLYPLASIPIPGMPLIKEGNTSYVDLGANIGEMGNVTFRLTPDTEFRMKLKAVQEGTHEIKVTAKSKWTERSGSSVDELMHYWLFIISSKDSGEFTREPPKELRPQVGTQLQKSVAE